MRRCTTPSVEALGGEELRAWQPGDARRRDAARVDAARAHAARRARPVRGLLPLPRRTRTATATFADELPRDRQRAEPARQRPALDPRGRLGEARPLRGARSRAVRELRPRRAPGPRRRRGRRSSGRSTSGTAACRPASSRTRSSRRWSRRCSTRRPPAGSLARTRCRADPEAASSTDEVEAPFLQLVHGAALARDASRRARTSSRSPGSRRSAAPQQIVENHLLEALGRLTPARAGRRRRRSSASSSRARRRRSPTPPPTSPNGRDAPSRRSRPSLEKLCRGESGRILRPSPPPAERDRRERYELFHDVLAEPILEWRRDYEAEQRPRARRTRRFARIGGVLVALVAVFAALGIWALVQRSDAKRATKSATSLALASAARDELAKPPRRLAAPRPRGVPRRARVPRQASIDGRALEAARRSGAEAILRGDRRGVRASRSAPTGARSRPPASTERAAVGLAHAQPLGQPLPGTPTRSGASPSARTGTRSPPPATTGRCGSGTCATGAARWAAATSTRPSHERRLQPGRANTRLGGHDGQVRLWDVRGRRPSSARRSAATRTAS